MKKETREEVLNTICACFSDIRLRLLEQWRGESWYFPGGYYMLSYRNNNLLRNGRTVLYDEFVSSCSLKLKPVLVSEFYAASDEDLRALKRKVVKEAALILRARNPVIRSFLGEVK